MIGGAQQVYAVIRARSKYTNQQPRNGKKAVPFPVRFSGRVGYCVHGNGNQYRVEDCNFFVRLDGDANAWPDSWPFVEIMR